MGDGLRVAPEDPSAADSSLLTEWAALAVAAENPFAHPVWAGAWSTDGSGGEPEVLVCHRSGGEVAGVLPLVSERGRRLGPPGGALADWTAPASRPQDAEEVGAALGAWLAADGRAWRPGRVEPAAGWWEACACAVTAAGPAVLRDGDAEPMPLVDLARDVRGHLTALPGRHRRELARLRRRLEESDEVDVGRAEDEGDVIETMDALLALHARAWGPEATGAREAAFHRAVAHAAWTEGWLRLWRVRVSGRVVAALYGWRLGGRVFAYLQAYDPTAERSGAGTVLLHHAVEAAADEGATIFDMLRGAEFHKSRYETRRRMVVPVVAARPGSREALQTRGRQAARRAWRQIPPKHRAAVRTRLSLA